uniref:Uncharacterized protein n=1 Tax=Aegilops tauschii subsp. strangulata TaxID=200361 RepID=A0A453DF68_AEGTS
QMEEKPVDCLTSKLKRNHKSPAPPPLAFHGGNQHEKRQLRSMGDEVDAFSEELRRRPEVRIINKYAVLAAYVRITLKSIGALLLLWATVVLLGGFVSSMKKDDFWSVTIIAFVQAAGLVLSIQLFLNAIFFRFCYFLGP